MPEAIRIRLVFACYHSQNGECYYCPSAITPHNATWEHVIPRGWGGPNTDYNLVLACEECNKMKSRIESFITNQMGKHLDLTSRAALFLLRCSRLFRTVDAPADRKVHYFRMAEAMLRTVDHHLQVQAHEVPRVPRKMRGKFL